MQSTDQSGTGAEALATRVFGDPRLPRIVLVHGFTQSSRSWSDVGRHLAAGYHVIAVDLPGHGASETVRAEGLDATARLLKAVGGDAVYVGYSLGGRVALRLATMSPKFVRALVLVSASAGIADENERAKRRKSDHDLADRLDPREETSEGLTVADFLDEWLAQPLFEDLSIAAQDRASRIHNSRQGLAHSLRSIGTGSMNPLHPMLKKLTMPVLCLAGERDERYVKEARALCAAIGENASCKVVANCGHAVPFEHRDEFLTIVREFLSTVLA